MTLSPSPLEPQIRRPLLPSSVVSRKVEKVEGVVAAAAAAAKNRQPSSSSSQVRSCLLAIFRTSRATSPQGLATSGLRGN